jgi:hypothetical protein
MAIYIIEGKPGSGKTYYSVNHLLRKYYSFDNCIDEYVPKADILIISNIDNLQVDHTDFENLLEKSKLEDVFNIEKVSKLRRENKYRSIVFVIDDAQKWFHTKFYDKDVFYFFQYHRHEGIDIYLIVQDADSLPRQIKNLAETYIHACSRTLTSKMAFRYKFISNNEIIKSKIIKKNQDIFKMYRSMAAVEVDAPQPVFYKYIAVAVVMAFLMYAGFVHAFLPMFRGKGNDLDINKKDRLIRLKEQHTNENNSNKITNTRDVPPGSIEYAKLMERTIPDIKRQRDRIDSRNSNISRFAQDEKNCFTEQDIKMTDSRITVFDCDGVKKKYIDSEFVGELSRVASHPTRHKTANAIVNQGRLNSPRR